MKKFNVLTAVLVAGLSLVTAQVVSAQPMEQERGGSMEHRHGGPEGMGRMLKGLDLTDAAQKPNPAEHKALADKVVSLVRADVFDEVAARQLLEQQQGQMLEHGLARLKLQHDIRSILTPEQKEKLDARMERMRDKMVERKKS